MTRSSSAARIGIDARSLSAGPAGVGTYVSNLIHHLPYLDPLGVASPRNNFFWNQVRVPVTFRSRGWAAYHAPAYTAPLLDCRPLILTVHDVSYLANPDWYPYPVNSWRLRYYTASLRRADRIIVPSDFSRTEILRFLPQVEARIRRVYMGVSDKDFFPDPLGADKARRELLLPESFLLHVGDIHQRRNIPLAMEAQRESGFRSSWSAMRYGAARNSRNVRCDSLGSVPSACGESTQRRSHLSTPLCTRVSVCRSWRRWRVACRLWLRTPLASRKSAERPGSWLSRRCSPFAKVFSGQKKNATCIGKQVLHPRREFSWEKTARETEKVYAEVVPELR